MSIEFISAVFKRYRGKPQHKLTLLVLADAADTETGECWPSYEFIATRANVTRRSAMRYVAELVDQGVVEVLDRGGFRKDPSTGRQVFVSNVYRLDLAQINSLPEWLETTAQPVDNSVDNPVDNASHGDSPDTVRVTALSPCSGDSPVTLTVTLEPLEEPSIEDDDIETVRDHHMRERRRIRAAINNDQAIMRAQRAGERRGRA